MNKFVNAVYGVDGSLIPSEDLIDAKLQNLQVFDEKYKDKLWCPDCEKASLKVAAGPQKRYISTDSKSQHDPNCSYLIKVAGKRDIKTYTAYKTSAQINSDLKNFLTLQQKIAVKDPMSKQIQQHINQNVVFPTNANNHARKRIAQQKLNKFFTLNYDEGVPKYYYGKVEVTDKGETKGWHDFRLTDDHGKYLLSLGLVTFNKYNSKNDTDLKQKIKGLVNLNGRQVQIAIFGYVSGSEHYRDLKVFKADYIAF